MGMAMAMVWGGDGDGDGDSDGDDDDDDDADDADDNDNDGGDDDGDDDDDGGGGCGSGSGGGGWVAAVVVVGVRRTYTMSRQCPKGKNLRITDLATVSVSKFHQFSWSCRKAELWNRLWISADFGNSLFHQRPVPALRSGSVLFDQPLCAEWDRFLFSPEQQGYTIG